MYWKFALVFLVVFTITYVVVGWLYSESISWFGLAGGLMGGLIGFWLISRWRKSRDTPSEEH